MSLVRAVLAATFCIACTSISLSSTYDGKYLIGTFPDLRQVAYTILPDNVWRPLVIGTVSSPGGLAVDAQHSRLFVADVPNNRIYWYYLSVRDSDGMLFTDNVQRLAVAGYQANYLAVDGLGDLYFSGRLPTADADSVYRMDMANILAGITTNPTQVYTKSNSGAVPTCYMPGGIGVDSFYIYWGNQANGEENGSVNKGYRQNIEGEVGTSNMVSNENEVRGLTLTSTSVFYLTPNGVFGIPKTMSDATELEDNGLVSSPPDDEWDPRSMTWDSDGTGYISDGAGRVYTIPTDTNAHPLTHFVDAPGIWGITVLDFVQGPTVSSYTQVSATVVNSSGHRVSASAVIFVMTMLGVWFSL